MQEQVMTNKIKIKIDNNDYNNDNIILKVELVTPLYPWKITN